ncbi:structural maintenance of chromosomes flexible hinge domain protein, partial [Perilla frutescens var. frutescens]
DWTSVAKKGSVKLMEIELKKMFDTVQSIHDEIYYLPVQEPAAVVQSPVMSLLSSSTSRETFVTEKDEVSALKAGLRKVKIFTEYVLTRRAKKACLEEEGSEGRCSAKSEDSEYAYPFDSDSLEEYEEGESDEGKDDSAVRKSFSYGTLAFANYAGVSCYSSARINNEDEDLIYYSNRCRSDVGCSRIEDLVSNIAEQQVSMQNSKRSILRWRKKKLSFRSPKAKGEPLLKKSYGEGGDDIDFDRRQFSSDECASLGVRNLILSFYLKLRYKKSYI